MTTRPRLGPGQLASAFELYWRDLDSAMRAGAHWTVLHVVVCVPDICAALESPDGKTNGSRYVAWCERNWKHQLLSGAERYRMRCKVLHEGRATSDDSGRYARFFFGCSADGMQIDHMRVDGGNLHLDVGRLLAEVRSAVARWALELEAALDSETALSAARNLPELVRVRATSAPARVGFPAGMPLVLTINKTS